MRIRTLATAILVVSALLAVPSAQKPADLTVTVAYTGKGPVDAAHGILVFLFTDAELGPTSIPVAVQEVTKSGGTATFKGVTQDPVYVVMAYDEKDTYDGKSGPPPAGTPVGNYGKDGKLIPVSPAKTPKIKATFDDSVRYGQQ
jgi:hypothetical protein